LAAILVLEETEIFIKKSGGGGKKLIKKEEEPSTRSVRVEGTS